MAVNAVAGMAGTTARHIAEKRPSSALLLRSHAVLKGAQLNEADAKRVLQHLADLWSYDVSLVEVDQSGTTLKEYVTHPRKLAAAA